MEKTSEAMEKTSENLEAGHKTIFPFLAEMGTQGNFYSPIDWIAVVPYDLILKHSADISDYCAGSIGSVKATGYGRPISNPMNKILELKFEPGRISVFLEGGLSGTLDFNFENPESCRIGYHRHNNYAEKIDFTFWPHSWEELNTGNKYFSLTVIRKLDEYNLSRPATLEELASHDKNDKTARIIGLPAYFASRTAPWVKPKE